MQGGVDPPKGEEATAAVWGVTHVGTMGDVTKRFLHDSARHVASRVETWTIRLKIALRIFLGLGKTLEMACHGGLSLGMSGSWFKIYPWFVWFGSKLCRDEIYNCEIMISNAGHSHRVPRPNTTNRNINN